ncbi:pirin family protein [Polaromonas naphthalenivorans]|uniref:Pirin domain protein n=1 Tax=Polaromonas naphthalenivorans (strain CJ2) TaxID=365044 RepID=A1VRE9_POLNA|nr:pirin family protein [Polaromonas naphthalenivorans]ABM38227.1 Pirin domain protein [Polaromonas naphthalenivorans CJ2]
MTLELKLTGHDKDLGGGFMVSRLLPAATRQSVGPFIFFDHFGPFTVQADANHDVRPHPHIGLATVTYLFEGAMLHRDSLGSVQRIEPGAINWMTAGRGIVHSERAPDDLRGKVYQQHGLQLWAALPKIHEEAEPDFVHTPAAAIPVVPLGASELRVLIGEAFGHTSPVRTFSKTVYLDIRLAAGERIDLPPLADELALYGVDGDLQVDGEAVAARTLAVLAPGAVTQISANAPARFVVIGGDKLDGKRFIWWNFVSSSKERIAQAGDDWAAQRMGQIAGDAEFIPLPERKPALAEPAAPKAPYL